MPFSSSGYFSCMIWSGRRRRPGSCSAPAVWERAASARCTSRTPLRSRPSRRRRGCRRRRWRLRRDPGSRRCCSSTSGLRRPVRQRLDQDGGLDRHVQAAGDAGALERLLSAELFAQRHQTGHLVLGDGDLFAAPAGELDVLDLIISETTGDGHLENSCGKLCSNDWARFIRVDCRQA